MMIMSGYDAYCRCVAGVDDTTDADFLDAARYVELNKLRTPEALWVLDVALGRWGPETVYMDGELFANEVY